MQDHTNVKSFDEVFQALQDLDETDWIEAKKYSTVLGASFLKTVSAFSNERGLGGGYILCGVIRNESDGKYVISGVEDVDDLKLQIADQCKHRFNVEIHPIIKTVKRPEGNALLVFIPEAEAHNKPIFIKEKGLHKGAYRRIGSATHVCIDDELSFMNFEKFNIKYDELPLTEASLEDFDSAAVNEYRRLKFLIQPSASELKCDDRGMLRSLGAIVERSGKEYPTVAGLLLFGKTQVIQRKFGDAARIEYNLIDGLEWVPSTEKRYTDEEFCGPLILVFHKLLKAIMDDIPNEHGLDAEDIMRTETPIIPRKVVREALCNALMHRDYAFRRSIRINKFSNRIEFVNPGFALKSEFEIEKAGSAARNGTITKVFRELLFAETKGTGLKLAQEEMLSRGYTIPLIGSTKYNNQFQYTIVPLHISDEKNTEWVTRFKDYDLSQNDLRILILLRELGDIRIADYRMLYKVDAATATAHLRKLSELGLIYDRGADSIVYYVPTDKFWRVLSGKDTAQNQSALADTALTFIPAEVIADIKRDNVEMVVEVLKEVQAAGKKIPNKVMRGFVKKLCSIQPFTSAQLAIMFNKNTRKLQKAILKPMVDSGDLRLEFPDSPNHKKQAYRVCSVSE